MSVPRITEILEEEIQRQFDSKDEAMRMAATSAAIAFATLRELKKIRLILTDETGTEISDDDIDEDEEIV